MNTDWLNYIDIYWRRYRWYLRLPSYLAYRAWLAEQSTKLSTNRPLVVFDFQDTRIDGPQGRRVYALFMFFVRAGYYPVFVPNYLFLANIGLKLKGLLLQEQFSIVNVGDLQGQPYVLVTDRASKFAAGAKRVVCIDYRPSHDADGDAVPMPFSLFPKLYAQGEDLKLAQYRTASRHWDVFFGGDAEPKKYSKPSIPKVYGKVSRPKMLSALRKQLAAARVYEPADQTGFDALLRRNVDGVVLMNTRFCRAPADQWLQTMARAKFYLACPGYRYPMSHNAIEALAVGTVPIIEYPEQFFPALQDGLNCLVFSGLDDLVAVTRRAIDMPDAQWETLSTGAAEYYDQYLSPEPLVARLMRAQADTHNRVYLRYLPFLKTGGGFA